MASETAGTQRRTDEPLERYVEVEPGVRVCVFEWAGDGPTVVFSHGNSFHARCWDETIRRLPGVHAYAVDARGHGRSDKPDAAYPSRRFGEDLAAVLDAFELRDVLGVGHSLGGHATHVAGALRPERFRALLLVDPVTMPTERLPSRNPTEGEHPAARRRAQWPSAEEMFEAMRSRPPMNRWDEQVLRDYCTYGLLPDPSGEGMTLACPPAIEGRVYQFWDGDLSPEMASVQLPVRLLRARERRPGEEGFGPSPADPAIASRLANVEEFYFPEFTHLFPMEEPGLIADHVNELLQAGVHHTR